MPSPRPGRCRCRCPKCSRHGSHRTRRKAKYSHSSSCCCCPHRCHHCHRDGCRRDHLSRERWVGQPASDMTGASAHTHMCALLKHALAPATSLCSGQTPNVSSAPLATLNNGMPKEHTAASASASAEAGTGGGSGIVTLEDGVFWFLCPHCAGGITVDRSQIHCTVFRHGVWRQTGRQIDAHTPKEECDRLAREQLIRGCGKPFVFDGSTVRKCDYL